MPTKSTKGLIPLRPEKLYLCILLGSQSGWAADYFDPELLSLGTGNSDVDLSAFSSSGGYAEGDYLVNIFINQRDSFSRELAFKKNSSGSIVPELTPELLNELGVDVKHLPLLKDMPEDQPIMDLPAIIPHSSVKFNLASLRLDISIPQIAMQPGQESRIQPELWDDGIPALLANYSLSAGRNDQTINDEKRASNNLFATVRAGANAGPWRLRSTITHSHTDYDGGKYGQSIHSDITRFSNTYLARDIRQWRSSLLMGESSTGSDVLDGVPFRGIQLRSSDQMMPARLRGFSPQISGVASSNARITVRQNGYVIYETYVAPGPFDIKDIYQANMAGDLDVTVTEADGSQHGFVVPYSSLPVMLRPGGFKYEVSVGKYDGATARHSRQSDFIMATLIYGLPKNVTLYGGGLASEFYTALTLGTGISLGYMGAISADGTLSRAKFAHENDANGGSWRLRYSKSMLSTGTSLDLTALRYSTRNFYTFSEYNGTGYEGRDEDSLSGSHHRRSSFQTQISQQMGNYGSLSLRANRDDYWGTTKTLNGLSAGYTGNLAGISYGINYTIDRLKGKGNWPENRQISVNLSVPFTIFGYSSALQNTYASAQTIHDKRGQTQNQAGINGSRSDGRLSYSLMQSWGNQQQVRSSNLNVGYQGSKGSVTAGYGYSKDMRSINMNMSGGMIAHAEGLTLSRTLGSSVALVSAPGAAGVHLSNGGGVTDWNGYAVMPYLNDYASNSVGLDPGTLPDNVDLPQNQLKVYPTNGAVVKAKFATRVGHQALMTLTRAGALGFVPFGATASLIGSNAQDETTGIVGDNGQVYLTGLPAAGQLKVVWGKSSDKQCKVSFNLKDHQPSEQMPVIHVNGDCR